MNHLSDNIKFLRIKNNLTQKQLSECSGVSQHSISDIEKKEEPNPELQTLIALSNHFGYSIDSMVNTDLSKETDLFNLGIRKPTSGQTEFSYFEGHKYFVYFLSERPSEKTFSGTIEFDKHFDEEHLFLHGTVKTGHNYDVRMVIEGTASVYLYGTERHLPRRFYMALFFPDFRNDEKEYIGGLGIVNRLDTRKYHTGMKVALSQKEIKDEDKLLEYLDVGESKSRVWVTRDDDLKFRDYVAGL